MKFLLVKEKSELCGQSKIAGECRSCMSFQRLFYGCVFCFRFEFLVFVLFVCCTGCGKGLLNINICDRLNSSQEVKSLERNSNTSEFDQEIPVVIKSQDASENAVCDVCGEEFEHPLFAELISGDHAEEYYACPRCLTKVGEVERQERLAVEEVDEAVEEEGEETTVVEEVVELPPEPEEVKSPGSSGCPYYLGYLKKRPKNAPIPENCFVCAKMIECTR
jgi:hypothetical protein